MKYCCDKSKKYIAEGYNGYPIMICDYRGALTGDFVDDAENVYILYCPFCGDKL